MTTEYVTLTKSQKALSDTINLAKAIIDGSQVTYNELPVSEDKSAFLVTCANFDGAIGKFDKLTITAMSRVVNAQYKKLIKGESAKASTKYEREIAQLKASLLLGADVNDLVKKQNDRHNSALYRKNLLLTDKSLQALINPVMEDETDAEGGEVLASEDTTE
jgi:hypothetical protein